MCLGGIESVTDSEFCPVQIFSVLQLKGQTIRKHTVSDYPDVTGPASFQLSLALGGPVSIRSKLEFDLTSERSIFDCLRTWLLFLKI